MPVIDVTSLIGELRALYVALVPALSTSGVYEAEHAAQVPWSEYALPYGVIIASDFAGTRRALGSLAFISPVELWYVDAAQGPSSGIRTVLETLLDGFWPSPSFAHGQVRDVTAWGYGADLAPNRLFGAEGPTRRAGFVRLSVLVGRSRA